MKTGSPFQTICITSPGGKQDTSTSKYVSLSYLFQPERNPIIDKAASQENAIKPPTASVLIM